MQNTAAVWMLQQCEAVPWAGGAQVQHPCARGGGGQAASPPPPPPHPLLFSNVENPWALKYKVNAFNVAQSQSMLEEACWGKHVGRQAWCTLVCSWDQSHMPLHYMLHYNVWQLHSTQAGTAAQFHDTAQLPGAGRWC